MNNTCRYRLKCQPEYRHPYHYHCRVRDPDVPVELGFGRCLLFPCLLKHASLCETTHFPVPLANFVGSLWEVYLYAREEDMDWHLEDETDPNRVPKTRWFPCPDNGDLWDLPLDEHGSLDENDPIWALNPEWLAYPTPGP